MEPLTSNFWLTEAALLYGLVFDIVEEASQKGALSAAQGILQMLLGVHTPEVDLNLLNEAAHAYAQQHTFELVSGVTETSQKVLQAQFSEWIASGEPLPKLVDALAPMFGPVRADMIASTEITRAYHNSNVLAWKEYGADGWTYQTAVDDIVCPICGPLHDREFPLDETENAPPVHPRCRCFSKPRIRVPEIA